MCMQSNTLIPKYGNNFCKHAFSFCELPMWALLHLWKMIIFARNNPCVCGKSLYCRFTEEKNLLAEFISTYRFKVVFLRYEM